MKKIDTSKSIIFGREMNDLKASFEYLNKEGYFSDYENFSDYKEGILTAILVSDDVGFPYESTKHENFSYFIPKNNVVFSEEQANKYRPFKNVEEFVSVTRCGSLGSSILRYRHKSEHRERVMVFIGYTDDNRVVLGGTIHSLTNLFEDYEYYDNDYQEWKPFGVEK